MLSVGRPENSSTESLESKINCYYLTVYRCCEVSLAFAFEYRLVRLEGNMSDKHYRIIGLPLNPVVREYAGLWG